MTIYNMISAKDMKLETQFYLELDWYTGTLWNLSLEFEQMDIENKNSESRLSLIFQSWDLTYQYLNLKPTDLNLQDRLQA
jgi:hypothetical protein